MVLQVCGIRSFGMWLYSTPYNMYMVHWLLAHNRCAACWTRLLINVWLIHMGVTGVCVSVSVCVAIEPGACVWRVWLPGQVFTELGRLLACGLLKRFIPGLWFVVFAHFCTARRVAPLQSLNLQVNLLTTIASTCWDWVSGRQHKEARILISAYTCARCFTFSYLHVC